MCRLAFKSLYPRDTEHGHHLFAESLFVRYDLLKRDAQLSSIRMTVKAEYSPIVLSLNNIPHLFSSSSA